MLFVGTVESRKNHLLALRAWQVLLDRHGPASVPDLVCVGRLGWHADTFLHEYVESAGLGGKLSVLSSSVTAEELARLYSHAEFTIYPSRYEGWGLPVSESLAFGRLPVVAYNSSLPEAGRDLAAFFRSDDLEDFVHVLETRALDLTARTEAEARIRADRAPAIAWADVADTAESALASFQDNARCIDEIVKNNIIRAQLARQRAGSELEESELHELSELLRSRGK